MTQLSITRASLLIAFACACGSSTDDTPDASGATGPAGANSAGAAGTGAGGAGAGVGGAGAGATSGASGNASGGMSGATGGMSTDASMAGADACAGECGSGGSDASSDAGALPTSCVSCTGYATPSLLANVAVAALAELSGVAASVRNPGVLFAHNNRARGVLYALDMQGALRGTFTLTDADVSDVEDLATGPCGAERCLYLADIGGNLSPRTEFAILRMQEPEVATDGVPIDTTLPFEHFRFEYDDAQNHNAEGVLVDPGSGVVYIVTKLANGQASSVYRLPDPMSESGVNVAVKVADLPVPHSDDEAASAAAAHPCGTGFLIRTYDAVYEFRIPAGAPFEDAFDVTPVALTPADEPQSEAISYLPDGRGFISTGETAAAPIFQTLCE